MTSYHEKNDALRRYLSSLPHLAVAFSSGVDSTFLLKTAQEVLGDNVMAITAASASFPERERTEALDFCRDNHIRHVICETDELAIPGFRENPKNRCYLCKKVLFSKIQATAAANGFTYVAEGSNTNDLGDYRPGLKAIAELGILSPLRAFDLTKDDIRRLSRDMALPTWHKPSFACLASRFVYGETISEEKLHMVGAAEDYLMANGFTQLRVRIHGTMARLEVMPEDFPRFADAALREKIYDYLKSLGFTYITLDLKGYRQGAMNETLTEGELALYALNTAERK